MSVLNRVRGVHGLLTVVATLLVSSCTGLAFDVANLAAPSGSFERKVDIPYGTLVRQRLDVYVPTGARAAPVIVFWYGGAWVKGSKEDYRFVGAALADAGFVVVLADYRLYPTVKFPDFLRDGATAVAWTRANIAQQGGDPDRIFLAGHSAGAHLAAMLAVQPHWLTEAGVDPVAIHGLIGLSGPYELQPDSPQLRAIFAAPYGPSDWQPLALVTAAAPPALLLHGGDDGVVYATQSEHFAAALRAAGVPVELQVYPDRGHADTVGALSVPGRGRAPVLESIVRFVSGRSAPSR